MYIILTNKPGQYRSEATDGLRPLEALAYHYEGRHIATFTIAELQRETRVRIVEETAPASINLVPTRFFEHFDTREAALGSLTRLVSASHADARLVALAEPVIVS
ncbi:hypothetical protein [Paraburkholderia sp. BR10882]|uniref:hypothetical protein n=1 Tax=unclassified Paraburkholderia TaxID=2615204 RepID=UPI0034CE22D9